MSMMMTTITTIRIWRRRMKINDEDGEDDHDDDDDDHDADDDDHNN